ncbi:BamA/TamA family outer membrane protein [Echinicola sp. CAU 1574]|uniref:BamA/TamA family outer membrane protein n=1 Tax=Echinicola arenosa TaxID=2774144 RepID=A0ABR9AIM1_9BACT|nr:BamA/TamA family outer membrane protein [Echinicola arenosa]MBD8488684.1 BamA/TamA family outer membrane protein [Echinicola arenosa]
MSNNSLIILTSLVFAFSITKVPVVFAQDDALKVSRDTSIYEGPEGGLFGTVEKVLDVLSTDTWSFIPAVTYSPETSLGVGAGAIKVFKSDKMVEQNLRPSSMPITFIYTLKKQAILELDLDLWKNYNKDYVNARLELTKYPFKFYGVGNDLPSENQEDYASRCVYFHLNYMRRILPDVYIGPRIEFRADNVYEKQEGGLLDSGSIPGSDKPRVSGLGLKLNYDSRDDVFQPQSGSYHQFTWMSFQPFLGSIYTYNRYELDLRKYVPVLRNKLLAVQAWWSFIEGEPPFQQMATIGGSRRMRGYFEGRYRDKMAMVYQAELRLPVYGNLGMVLFSNAGQVADKISTYGFDRFHYGGGFGVRYKLMDEGINIRIDFGFGDQTAFYFGLNEVI